MTNRLSFWLIIGFLVIPPAYRLSTSIGGILKTELLLSRNDDERPSFKLIPITADYYNCSQTALFDSNRPPNNTTSCAILFYGLPREFSMVLPSIVQNIICPNARYGCDFFVHSHILMEEPSGRMNFGGKLDPSLVRHLEDAVNAVHAHYPARPRVYFTNTTDDEFYNKYQNLLHEYRTARYNNRSLYFPQDRELKWHFENHPVMLDNIVKMWHGQQSVWESMEQQQANDLRKYQRVGLFRSDVFFSTPINIYQLDNGTMDYNNTVGVIPGFARYPINDRMFYGPYQAAKIWASERFARAENHSKLHPKSGIHSESYLKDTLIPAIREKNRVSVNFDICFYRVRSGGIIMIEDCDKDKGFVRNMTGDQQHLRAITEILQHTNCIRVAKKNKRKADVSEICLEETKK